MNRLTAPTVIGTARSAVLLPCAGRSRISSHRLIGSTIRAVAITQDSAMPPGSAARVTATSRPILSTEKTRFSIGTAVALPTAVRT